MYESQNYIEKPINLLSFDSLGHAILNYDAIQIIQSIPKPISILSVAGPYRTGKSFLLNSLISGKEQFQVSSTTRSCTKGLWIWGKPLTSLDEKGKITNVLIIDTEGFGSCEQTHDKRIIILALLLSSSFIYNSKGLIDGDSLTDLRYVIEETKKVKRQLCFDSVTDFHWILRDFHYQMVNELNLKISPNQYMEKSLKEYSDNFPQHKEVYKILCEFFRNRSCHTLITPETDPSVEQNPEFVEQLIKLKKILTGVPSLDLNGGTLSQIIEAYVSAMNDNYTETGVYREGAQCRLRINCLSQLCKELETITREDQPEKRVRLIKLALHEVEDTFISKMKSDKQIRILKQEINVLISQFEETSIPSNKNIRMREPRCSLSLPKIKPQRASTQANEFCSQKQLRPTNKIQLVTLQRAKEELQAKIHRYELEMQQINEQLQSLKETNSKLDSQKLHLEQKLTDFSQQLMSKNNFYTLKQLEMQQKFDAYKGESFESYSELEKQNKLFEEKVNYFERKIAEMEIQQMEAQEGTISRYKEHISFLEKENLEILAKHEAQIKQLKLFYQCQDQQNDHIQRTVPVLQAQNMEVSRQIRTYCDKINQLEEENSKLMDRKAQAELKILQLQKKNVAMIKNFEIETQQLQKKHKQRQSKVVEVYLSQIQAKQKIISDFQNKLKQQRTTNQEELNIAIKKYEQLGYQMAQNEAQFQHQAKILKEQYLEVCEKYETQQALRLQKERQIQKITEQVEIQRDYLSKNYNEHYETVRALRNQISANDFKYQQLRLEGQKNKSHAQQLEQQLRRQKQNYEHYKQELDKIHEIQKSRLQATIISLTNTNKFLKDINQKSKDLGDLLAQEQEEKEQIVQRLKSKQEDIIGLNGQIFMLKQEIKRMGKIVQELSRSIQANQQELEAFAQRNNQKLQQRQQKYEQMLKNLHEKEKQYYILKQRLDSERKQHESKQKLAQKSFNQKLIEKNNEIKSISSVFSTQTQRLNQIQAQLIKMRSSYSLLEQRYAHLQENSQVQIKDIKERSNRDGQKWTVEAARLQAAIARLKQQNDSLRKTLRIYENDARETSSVLTDIRKKSQRSIQQYQSNLKLMRKKITELEKQNNTLTHNLQKTTNKLSCIETSKQILQENYNEDYKLWCSKIKVYEGREQRRSSG